MLYDTTMKTQKLSQKYLRELGHRFRIIRTILKLDQKQMSELIGTVQSQISMIEAGRSVPTLHQLIKIKRIAEEDDYLRENLSWKWILEGKGRGVIG